jgi:hypothetical protein
LTIIFRHKSIIVQSDMQSLVIQTSTSCMYALCSVPVSKIVDYYDSVVHGRTRKTKTEGRAPTRGTRCMRWRRRTGPVTSGRTSSFF